MEMTFNELPRAVGDLQASVKNIERLLLNLSSEPASESDEFLTVQETAKFLTLSVPTIYGLISRHELPVMKRAKRCYFSKVELIKYLKDGRKKAMSETSTVANNYLISKTPKK